MIQLAFSLFIQRLDYKDKEEKMDPFTKKGSKRVNVIGSKIKGMLNMYDK